MDIATLGLEIRSDGVVVAKNRLRDFDHQAGLTEKRAAAMGAAVGRLLGAIGAALSIRELVGYADAWSDMQSRVGAAIKDMDAAPALMQRMVELANASYSPLSQTVEVYSRNVGVLRDLGYSAGQAADFTEALNHALVITATRGDRAASVQNALAKAMAVGKLQADGLETVLANGGRVAEALAAELGTTVSGLRTMASEGKITGDVIARALTGRLQELRDEAAEMPATIGDAFTRIQTNLTALIGTLDKTYGASSAVAEVILSLADNMEMLVPIAGTLATVLTVSMIPAIASATLSFGLLTAAMLANPFVQIGLLAGALAGTIIHLKQQQGLAAQAAQTHAEALTTNANAIEVAKTSSQGFRDGLRSQIELQVAAARAALDEAGAQYQAAKVKAAAADAFGTTMQNLSQALFGEGRDPKYGAGIMDDALAGINTAYSRLQDLEGQLSKLGDVEATYKPIEHTVASLNGVGTAAKAANDNAKTLGQTLSDAARAAAQEWDFYRQTFSGFFLDMKRGLQDGQTFWEALGNAGANALDRIADRALSMAANGIFDMIFGAFMGGNGGNSLGGWGVAGGFGRPGIFGIPGMADGGTVGRAGLSWVGERGPELLRLPVGAQVIPNGPSMAMAANGNGGNDNHRRGDVHVHINGSGLSQEQMTRAIADALDQYDRKTLPRRVNELKNNSMVVNG